VCDRARTSSFRAGVVTADHALHAGLPREALKDVLAHCKRWPGKQRAAAVAELAEPLTESALESISRVLFKDSALPMPRPQATVRDSYGGFVARVDFLWEELGVVGEADGDVKYTSPFGVEAESAQRLGPLLLEKRRQEAIENQGLEVVRWSYADILSRPVQTDARIRAAFRRAERLRGPAA
jgi:hypothetical protein